MFYVMTFLCAVSLVLHGIILRCYAISIDWHLTLNQPLKFHVTVELQWLEH